MTARQVRFVERAMRVACWTLPVAAMAFAAWQAVSGDGGLAFVLGALGVAMLVICKIFVGWPRGERP